MKVLLDECVDRRLGKHLAGHDVKTVAQMGWSGMDDGRLLGQAERQFDVFITVDRNLAFQQHLPQFTIAVIVLHAVSNRIADLLPLVPLMLAAIPIAKPGEALSVP